MIQINLLPDVKIAYIKARRMKRIVIFMSVVTASSALALFIMLFVFVGVLQKKHISDLTADINSKVKAISDIEDVDRILTVQNQLNSLPDLHKNKPIVSRLYTFMEQTVPPGIVLTSVSTDFQKNTIRLSGNADTLVTVNKLVDTLKFTNYYVGTNTTASKRAFSKVVMTQFSRGEKDATFEVNLAYDPSIFAAQKGDNGQTDVSLQIPQQETTRSSIGRPGGSPFNGTGGGQ